MRSFGREWEVLLTRLVLALLVCALMAASTAAYGSWDWRDERAPSFAAQLQDLLAELGTYIERAAASNAASPDFLAELRTLLQNARALEEELLASPAPTAEQPESRWDRLAGSQIMGFAGPVGRWVFQDAREGTARDSAAPRNHGTVSGPTPTTSPFGQEAEAYYFGGSRPDHHIDVGNSPIFAGQDQFSLVAWIRPSSLSSSWGTIISKHSQFADGEWYLAVRRGGFRFAHVGDGGFRRNLQWDYDVVQDEWIHVALVFERGKVTLYVNGVDLGTQQSSGGTNSTTWPVLIGTIAGASMDSGWNFLGALHDVRFYNKALYSGYVGSLVPRDTGF